MFGSIILDTLHKYILRCPRESHNIVSDNINFKGIFVILPKIISELENS